MNKLTTEEFIRRGRKVHGDKFDYSRVVYHNQKTKVEIKCNDCGLVFWQIPSNHMRGEGCPGCKRLSAEEFIKMAKQIHGDKFDYSVTHYTTRRNPVKVRCKTCGEIFTVRAGHLLDGQGCPVCWRNRMTTEKFVEKAKRLFGDKCDYSNTVYVNMRTPIQFVCPKHGVITQMPNQHLHGEGCPICSVESKITTEQFIEKARLVHGDRFDYSLTEYVSRAQNVKIICKKHGVFEQLPSNHLDGSICPECARIERGERSRISQDEFIRRAKEEHGDRYDYSETVYISMERPITYRCPKHGYVTQTASNHLNGNGCPVCASSRGERRVYNWLKKHNIRFQTQFMLRRPKGGTLNGRILSDFFVPEANTIIEYNGIQHYIYDDYYGKDGRFERQQRRDRDVREICKKRGINLIEIPYTDFDNISQILEERLIPLINTPTP